MLGAVVGDVIGSRFEFKPHKSTEFELIHEECIYTDDTVMTLALAEAMAANDTDYAAAMRRRGVEWVTSYGPTFWKWLNRPDMGPYGSWGNGSAMRVSPASWFATNLQQCVDLAEATAAVSHDHPEGIRAARATAASIHAARSRWEPERIKAMLEQVFGYDMSRSVAEIRRTAEFELKAWISVPEALQCALEATSFEQTIRMAVSLGADADTQAAIAGAVAEGRFGVPEGIANAAIRKLPSDLKHALIASMRAAKRVPFEPSNPDDLPRIRPWSPSENEDWRHRQHRLAMEDGEAQALDSWEAFGESLQHRPSRRRGLFSRIFHR